MDSLLFDDQHQPIPNWMEKLAETEFNESGCADEPEDDAADKKAAKYNGITSTWQQPNEIKRSFDETVDERSLNNKSARKVSLDEVELAAKRLIFKRCSLDKVESELKMTFESNVVEDFIKNRFSNIEKEFGKLGYIYADANIATETDCDDVRSFLASMGKVSSLAISKVRKAAKCDGCSFNKSGDCLKLGMKIVENPEIKTAEEARLVLNRFASLKYINSTFIKSAELITYYNRLKTEDPQLVIKAFLEDVDNRRSEVQTSDSRVAAKDDKRDIEQIAVIPKITFKLGAEDRDVENSLKQSLLANPDLKLAKKDAEEKFGDDRVKAYMKEAKDVIEKYVKFLNRKAKDQDAGYLIENKESQNEIISKISSDTLKNANDALYTALDNGIHISNAHKDLIRSFGGEVAKLVIDKHASDMADSKLGHLYIALNKKAGTEHVSTFNDQTRIDTHREAMRILNFAKKIEFANYEDVDNVVAKLAQHGNADAVRSFLVSTKTKKKIASELVDNRDSHREVMSKVSDDLLKNASNALHIALDNGIHISSAHKDLARSFGGEVAKLVIDKHASDINDHKLGHLYMALNKRASAEHTSVFNDQTKIDTHREAMRILNFAKKIEFADNKDINKVQAKLKQHGNANIIRAFLLTTKPKKKLAADRVDSIISIALKYASSDKRIEIRKYAGDSWTNVSQLANVLSDKVLIVNKKAFREEIENSIQKSANDANAILSQPNQCSADIGKDDPGSFDFPLSNTF